LKVPLLDLRAQYAALRDELTAALTSVCEEQVFVLGPRVEAFEREIAKFCGVSHAVGVKSGSDALYLALLAHEVGAGDEVITTPFSFFATAGAIVRVGATPVFADVDPQTLNLDVEQTRASVSDKTRAILPVHLFGVPAELDELLRIGDAHGVPVIEDAAQALGARYRGRAAGSVGRIGCFSFHPSKPLGAFGDGGMLITNDEALAGRLRKLRVHGATGKYEHELPGGGNHRLDALQAAVLSVKLRHLERFLRARADIAAYYAHELAGVEGIDLPALPEGRTSSHSVFTLRVKDGRRDALKRALAEQGVETAIHYPRPLHLQRALSRFRRGALPVAERAALEVLSLPLYPELGTERAEYVVARVRAFFAGGA
jgi:dTDP-4-amino-4,6-dideoxygalactose transaminase